jgi:hypothetical protein
MRPQENNINQDAIQSSFERSDLSPSEQMYRAGLLLGVEAAAACVNLTDRTFGKLQPVIHVVHEARALVQEMVHLIGDPEDY